MNFTLSERTTAALVADGQAGDPREDPRVRSRSGDGPAQEPRGYRVHTNTWTAYGAQLNVDEVFRVLDRVDEDHFTAAVESLKPAEGEAGATD